MLWGTRGRLRSVAAAEALALAGWQAVLGAGAAGVVALTDAGLLAERPRARDAGMARVAGLLARAHALALDTRAPGPRARPRPRPRRPLRPARRRHRARHRPRRPRPRPRRRARRPRPPRAAPRSSSSRTPSRPRRPPPPSPFLTEDGRVARARFSALPEARAARLAALRLPGLTAERLATRMTPPIVAELHPPRLPADFVATGWPDLLAAFGLGLLARRARSPSSSRPLLRPRPRRESVAARLARAAALPPDERLLAQLRLLAETGTPAPARPPRRALHRRTPPDPAALDALLAPRAPCLTSPLPLALLALPLPLLVRAAPRPRRRRPGALAAARRSPPAPAPPPPAASTAPAPSSSRSGSASSSPPPSRSASSPVPDRTASGRDIVLALDLSGSMAIEDFSLDGVTASRLDAVKRVATRFVEARRGDRIGVVIFADRAYVAAPLTWDLTAVSRAIDGAEIGLTGRSTAIADGLGLALKRILADPARSRVIVLLSDGRDTAARLDPRQVGRLAAEDGVRVHTIALGPEDLEDDARTPATPSTSPPCATSPPRSGGTHLARAHHGRPHRHGRRARPPRAQPLRAARR